MRLRMLRESLNYSVDDISLIIGVDAKIINGWESGTVEPTLRDKRDLSMIYGVDIHNLLTSDPYLAETESASLGYMDKEGLTSGFWGHLGIKYNGKDKTEWFPVSGQMANKLSGDLRLIDDKDDWVSIQTLNNRLLIFKPSELDSILLLDEACDAPAGDWENYLDLNGAPLALYRAVDDYLSGFLDRKTCSDHFFETVENFVLSFGMDEDSLRRHLAETRIVMTSGHVVSDIVSVSDIHALWQDVEDDVNCIILSLDNEYGEIIRRVPSVKVAIINAPLYPVTDLERDQVAA